MGISVGVNPPKTPVTKGSHGIAQNTIPNICKMPGPPAPFVPTPLPNIAKSELNPQGYSTTVEIEGNAVAIRGATFESIGDIASKGTGGGLISANCQGPAKFISPGSMTVMIEGKNVQQLGDMMLNNCGPGGSPPNTGATMGGETQADQGGDNPIVVDCDKGPPSREGQTPALSDCEKEELCSKGRAINEKAKAGKLKRITGEDKEKVDKLRAAELGKLNRAARAGNPAPLEGFTGISDKCKDEMKADATSKGYKGYSADHVQDIGLDGHPTAADNLKWMSSKMNTWIGSITGHFEPGVHTGLDVRTCCK